MSNYLRNRPFMVVTYKFVLAPGQKSNASNFGQSAEWEPVESMVIVDRVSNKMEQSAELILDLLENRVIKSRNVSGAEEQKKLFETFVSRHASEVKSALATWITKDPTNVSKIKDFVAAHSSKKENVNDEE